MRPTVSLRAIVALSLLIPLVAVLGADPASATSISASSEAEYRAALAAISTDAAGPHTLTLGADLVLDDGTDPTYTGAQALTIDGDGHTIDARCTSRILALGTGAGSPITFTDVTLTGGCGVTGGAVWGTARAINVVDATFRRNNATGTGGGGAIAAGSGNLTIHGSRLTGNWTSSGSGGAIVTTGSLSVTGTTFAFNTANATGDGGAVSVGNGVTAIDSTFRHNQAGGEGGALHSNGATSLLRVTVAGNAAAEGGGLRSHTATIGDSTISGNLADVAGGGLLALGANVDRSTIVGNQAPDGANVSTQGGGLTSGRSIYGSPGGAGDNCTTMGSFSSNGYNWSSDGTCWFSGVGDVLNGGSADLLPLASDGGPTPTQLPTGTSSLRDLIPAAACGASSDQRGQPRPFPADGFCDVGATERQGVANGLIAFTTSRNGAYEIYRMDADGNQVTRLTDNSVVDMDPAWSRDGSRIAFRSARDGNFEIYTMNADGTGATRLTSNSAADTAPAWSPDGTRIAFTSIRDGNNEIYAMNADGTGATRLTDSPGSDVEPAWSPDGSRIAFSSTRDGNEEIYTMDADGTGLVRVTDNGAGDADTDAAWSPDGTRIAFATNEHDVDDYEIATVDPDGTDVTVVTGATGNDLEPVWSPDGTRIAFATERYGGFEVASMAVDGTDVARLTTDAGVDVNPAWQPIDTGDPTVTLNSPADGATYSSDYPLLADYACGDEGVGQFGCNGDVASGSPVDMTVGEHTFTVHAVDYAGNATTVVHRYVVLDGTNPTATLVTPPDGAVYARDAVVLADYSCQDEPGGSGVASCTGSVPDGDAIDTAVVGERLFNVDVVDLAGNRDQVTHTYTVALARPDGRLQLGAGPLRGNDVYSNLAAQTVSGSAPAGGRVTYYASVQNDARFRDALRLRGQGSTPQFTVRYFSPTGQNITAAVTAGTYATPQLGVRGTHRIRIEVTIARTAPRGTALSRTVTATSVTHPNRTDTVRTTTTRR